MSKTIANHEPPQGALFGGPKPGELPNFAGNTRKRSDGAVVCSECKQIIEYGSPYLEKVHYGTGTRLTRDLCMECAEREENEPFWTPFGAVMLLLLVLAVAFVWGSVAAGCASTGAGRVW